MSLKYTLVKAVFHIVPMQKVMAKPYEELIKKFKTKDAKPEIPNLSDAELTFETKMVGGFPVLSVSHRKPVHKVCIYVVGGGMLKYPKPSQAKGW